MKLDEIISEIQRVHNNSEDSDWSADGSTRPSSDVTPIPDNPDYAYRLHNFSERERLNLTGTDQRFYFYHRVDEKNYQYIGFIGLRAYRIPGLKNSYQISNAMLDSKFRGRGVGLLMYKTVLQSGYTIFADNTQTPDAIKLWTNLNRVPGIQVNGIFRIIRSLVDLSFANSWNKEDIEDNIKKLKRLGARPLGNHSRAGEYDYLTFTFPVREKQIKLKNAVRRELSAPGVQLYHRADIEDTEDIVNLYAQWVGNQSVKETVIKGNFGQKYNPNLGRMVQRSPYKKNPDIEVPVYDPVKKRAWHAAVSDPADREPFERFDVEPTGSTGSVAHIVGITKSGQRVRISTSDIRLAEILAAAYNRWGFSDVDIKRIPLGENFADGKNPGRRGLSRRVGIPKKATLAQLEKIARSSSGERRRMAQWQLNMRRGQQK